ncbi:efflux transporter, RND family, MFP subunit, partial [mine drainage metagenome]
NHQLLPGMFVNVRLAVGTAIHAFLLPQAAVQRNTSGDPYVLTVSPDDTVVEKDVQTEGTSGADWIVSKGLVDGERVIVSGIQEARPGRKVTVSSLRSVPGPDR